MERIPNIRPDECADPLSTFVQSQNGHGTDARAPYLADVHFKVFHLGIPLQVLQHGFFGGPAGFASPQPVQNHGIEFVIKDGFQVVQARNTGHLVNTSTCCL